MTKYRVLVSTDLGGDPDDIQSLTHLLHYSDVLRLEGLVSTSGPGADPRAELIREWVQRTDLDHLRSRGYPELLSEERVLGALAQGQQKAQAPGRDKATDGSRLIVERALADDPERAGRCLWVLVWGSLTDVAQSLHDEPAIAGRIRINYIGSSNTTNDPASRDFVYEGMKDRWPALWWIEDGILPKFSHDTFRGYYTGGTQEGIWSSQAFLQQVIRGRGTTHAGMFGDKLGDAMPTARHPGQQEGILKEGDTPTLLYLLSPIFGQVGNVYDPTQPGWGGEFRRPDPQRFPNYYTDLDAPAQECQATISRWRDDYLGHWQSRWQRY